MPRPRAGCTKKKNVSPSSFIGRQFEAIHGDEQADESGNKHPTIVLYTSLSSFLIHLIFLTYLSKI